MVHLQLGTSLVYVNASLCGGRPDGRIGERTQVVRHREDSVCTRGCIRKEWNVIDIGPHNFDVTRCPFLRQSFGRITGNGADSPVLVVEEGIGDAAARVAIMPTTTKSFDMLGLLIVG